MVYKFKEGFFEGKFRKIDPQTVGAELVRLRKKHEKINAEIIVSEAAHESSPIHDVFLWDDKKAAHKYRIQTANELVTSIVVVKKEQGVEKLEPLFICLRHSIIDRELVSGATAKKDILIQINMEKQCLSALSVWINRFSYHESCHPIINKVKEAIDQYNKMNEEKEVNFNQKMVKA